MKIKKGKEIWAIVILVVLGIVIGATAGAFILNGNFDTYNLILIFLLIFSFSSLVEKRK